MPSYLLYLQDVLRSEVAKLRRRGQGPYLTLQCAALLMDMRLLEVGCCRHPQQLDTPADGCCGVWATAVQVLSIPVTVDAKQRLREEVVDTLPVALERGVVNWDGQGGVQSPQAWMDNMRQKAVLVDQLWLQLAAAHFKRDFLLLPVFPERWEGGVCRLFGCLQDKPAPCPPVLLMIAEETQFLSPHYQVYPSIAVYVN